jgi:folate-dependent phosphoribosylglycinamide formyltransferase PurN
MSAERKVLILGRDSDSTRVLFHALQSEFAISAVILEEPASRARLLKNRMAKLGAAHVVGQLGFMAMNKLWIRPRSKRRIGEILSEAGLSREPIDPAVIRTTPSANDDDCRSLLARLRPDVVLISGTRILSPETLSCIPARFINVHAGITPLFRGVHGAFWALASGRPAECGVTVHLVDRGIDTGGILYQAVIQPDAGDSFPTYPYLQLARSIPLVRQALRDALTGKVVVRDPPPGESRLWSHPTLFEYLRARLRRGVR